MPDFDGPITTPKTLTGQGQVFNFLATSTLMVSGGSDAITENSAGDSNVINLDGIVRCEPSSSGGQAALTSLGDNTVVNIGADAFISSFNGLLMGGAAPVVRNFGTISAAGNGPNGVGIAVFGLTYDISNSGLISGNFGIQAGGDQGDIVNEVGGEIIGFRVGVQLTSVENNGSSFSNFGTVIGVGNGLAVQSGAGNDTIVNKGVIRGDVDLGAGGDLFDNRGGIVTGEIRGGSSGDTLKVSLATDILIELADGGINDRVMSTVSYVLTDFVEELELLGKKDINGTGTDTRNLLRGNSGDNVLKALDGNDGLIGRKGNDRLIGGDGEDDFLFFAGDGKDTIIDFEDGLDKILLDDIAFEDISGKIRQTGNDVTIKYGKTDTIILKNVDVSLIEASDFETF